MLPSPDPAPVRPRPRRRPVLALALALAALVPRPAAASSAWLHALAIAGPAIATPPATPPAEPLTLQARIDAVLAATFLAGATVGVHVVDLADGRVLYARNAELAQNPASNVKLVTTAAALALLGPEHRYVTRVYVDPKALKGHTIDGDLYLRGGGDPSLVTGDLYQLA
ncbi:MAG TPA: D-alanyl-D-alanine carboxypeptidase, partial [Nannocystis sp.]